MRNIAIYGAGGLGRETACMLEVINKVHPRWKLIGFFDDGKVPGEPVSHFGLVLGGMQELNAWSDELDVVLCFGVPGTLQAVRQRITNPKISFPNIIDPSFWISDKETFQIGEGNIIAGGCYVTTGVTLGNFNLLNGMVGIGHDTQIGDYNVFMPASKISGEVTIGDRNLFGTYSFVKQCLRIGSDVVLSPLSALLTKPKDNNTYIGNPAKKFKY